VHVAGSAAGSLWYVVLKGDPSGPWEPEQGCWVLLSLACLLFDLLAWWA
jgi:hypothetical protein